MEKALAWVKNNETQILENVKELLRIPSISAEKEFKEEVLKASQWVKANFERIGLETKLFETSGYPVVFAQTSINSNKPTVLIYFHYDVQPAGDEKLWNTPPFEPTENERRLWGRGTTDDKMQGLIHTVALEALMNSGEELPVNFKFCIEGEEEVSSPHVMDIVKENADLFRADYIVISDGPMLSSTLPSMEVGARGILYTQIKLSIGEKDMHSGQFGGYVKNANFELIRLINSLKDIDNKVTIPGFYSDIIPPTEAELESWNSISLTEEDYKKDAGVYTLDEGEVGYSLLERNWARPTCEVNGIWGGFTGEGAKTVIPNQSHAKISFRLVPGQDPKKILEEFKGWLKAQETEGIKIEVEWTEMAPAFLASPSDPVFEKARDAYAEVYGTKALLVRTGGTIGLLAGLHELYRVPVLLMNFGQPDENMHAPNENMGLDNFWKGIEVSLRLWHKLK
jgi:acetylornithine deacetylase/succinyl-diaminopimelate desuccinylase-like protein